MFPSFIRLNEAALWGLLALVLFGVRRHRLRFEICAIAALGLALAFNAAQHPGKTIHFEDTHVLHDGGRIYPDPYTLMRATYRNGWVLEPNQSATFLARQGTHTLQFITGLGATFELAGRAYTVGPNERYQSIDVTVPREGRVTLKVLSGALNLDRMDAR